jgi:quercetin dioxygenase-like cupin family protein
MHTTDAIDYGIALKGEMWVELDDGAEEHLGTEDCIIQNGTRHAWRNRGTEECVMAFVMVGAHRNRS